MLKHFLEKMYLMILIVANTSTRRIARPCRTPPHKREVTIFFKIKQKWTDRKQDRRKKVDTTKTTH
jgi:hypothetical protein